MADGSPGQAPAILPRSSGGHGWDGSKSFAHVGIIIGRLRRAAYTEASVVLEPGDRLLLFTDGIPEAAGPAGEQFGDERLQGFLKEHAALPSNAIADALLARIAAWTGRSEGFDDDLTLVVGGVSPE